MENNEKLISLVVDDTTYETRATSKFLRRRKFARHDPRKVVAHIPGIIDEICCAPGDAVHRGSSLVVLEAMKMKNTLVSPSRGTVDRVLVSKGQMVTKGQLLVLLK